MELGAGVGEEKMSDEVTALGGARKLCAVIVMTAIGAPSAVLAGIDTGGAAGIDTGGIYDVDAGGHHVLTGPVDSIDRDIGVFSSLGQTVSAGDDMLANLAVGDYIAVYGTVSGPGYLYADSVGRLPFGYVDGASEVFLVGLPTSLDTGRARIEIGSIRIDYSSSLSHGDHPSAGIVGFRGIRPNAGGDLIVVTQ